MAGDWIKMTHALRRSPEVVRITSRLKRDNSVTGVPPSVLRHVTISSLYTLWCIADEHATEEGFLPGYRLEDIDLEVGVEGFAAAVAEEGWLKAQEDGVYLPNFERHNGNSAKKRILAADRKRHERSVTKMSHVKRDNGHAKKGQKRDQRREEKRREEKRREEKSKKKTPPYPPAFEAFWSHYVRKDGKAYAFTMWKRLDPDAELQAVMIKATERQEETNHWRGHDGEDYRPHASTWINQRRWEDEIKERKGTADATRVGKFLPPVSDD